MVAGKAGRNACLAFECSDIAVVASLADKNTAISSIEIKTIDTCETLEIGETGKTGSQARFTCICKIIRVVSTWACKQARFVIQVIGIDATQTTCIRNTCHTG